MTDLQSTADRGLLIGVPLPAKTGKDRARVKALLEAVDCEPFTILAHIAMGHAAELGLDEPIGVSDRKDAAKELANYLAPKLKAIEHVDVVAMQGGVMLIPAPVSMDEWARIVQANKMKTIETEAEVMK